jgi:dTDP-4-amino-4,6-dideoxygalactose transaminase
MILTDNEDAVRWLKRARYEGRGPVKYHEDNISICGWNMYMSPEQATRGLMLMQNFPEHNEDMPEDPPYRDLREFDLFKG